MSSVQLAKPLLEVEDLAVIFNGRVKAVDNVSFTVGESESISLVGESGSGKTTVARAIAHLVKPTGGAIKYKGTRVDDLSSKRLLNYWKEVQLVFQDPYESLNPRQDVFTIVSTPMRNLLGEKNNKAILESCRNVLSDVGLDPSLNLRKFSHQMSGGERQRVNIARALASQPKLLIADEPVSMLDSAQRLNILVLLAKLRATKNLSILMITHDIASAKLLSGKVAVMYRGKIVEIGKAEEIIAAPSHPYTELLISSLPRINESGERKESMLEKVDDSTEAKGCIFRKRCKYATSVCEEKQPELTSRVNARYVACYHPLNT